MLGKRALNVARAGSGSGWGSVLGAGSSSFHHLSAELQSMKDAGTYKTERVITTRQSSAVGVTESDEQVINFCANNYLGLSGNEELASVASSTLDSHGFGLSSVRFICGTQDIHKQLEKEIAAFHGTDDYILYPSCFDANAGFFEATLSADDAIISDSLNHASIIDGIRLCKAARYRYEHMDMGDLEAKLIESKDARTRLIVTDGVFSMDGDVAPLKDICDLADEHNAQVFIDECHATGLFGATGRGTPEHCGVDGRVDIINSTLGKALGGATGGYTAGPQVVIDTLRQRSRPYLFSNTLAPPIVGASLRVFDMLKTSTDLVDSLRRNTHRFRDALESAGFELRGDRDHPIVPVMLGDARLASEMAAKMLSRGIYVVGFSYPVVPKGLARIRTQLSAAHTDEQIDKAAAAFVEVGREMGVIS